MNAYILPAFLMQGFGIVVAGLAYHGVPPIGIMGVMVIGAFIGAFLAQELVNAARPMAEGESAGTFADIAARLDAAAHRDMKREMSAAEDKEALRKVLQDFAQARSQRGTFAALAA